jgi:hemerythrin-like domain-containing protein
MKPTDVLSNEHNAIKVMLKILEAACLKLEADEKVPPEHLQQMVQFFREFADKCHHGKEEDLLFPAMQEAGIPREGGPIGMMLAEHQQGRAFVRGLDEAVGRYARGEAKAIADISQNARGYIELLTHHIYKEDNILFPMAERVISQGKLDSLLPEFEKIEIEKIGPGRHEQLHKMLEELKAFYLK